MWEQQSSLIVENTDRIKHWWVYLCLANGLTMGNGKDSVNLKTLVIIATYYATNIFRCTLHAYTGPLDPNAVSLYRSFTKSFLVKFGGFRTLGSDLPANDSGKKKRPSPSIIFTIYGRAGGKWISWGRYGSCTLWSFGRGPNVGVQEENMCLKVNKLILYHLKTKPYVCMQVMMDSSLGTRCNTKILRIV